MDDSTLPTGFRVSNLRELLGVDTTQDVENVSLEDCLTYIERVVDTISINPYKKAALRQVIRSITHELYHAQEYQDTNLLLSNLIYGVCIVSESNMEPNNKDVLLIQFITAIELVTSRQENVLDYLVENENEQVVVTRLDKLTDESKETVSAKSSN